MLPKLLLTFLTVFTLYAATANAVFWIVEDMATSQYSCGSHGELCCAPRAKYYKLHSSPTIPGPGNGCGIPGKQEGTPPIFSETLGTCTYGDYKGLGNTWAFCQTDYGGNLYLNGKHKRCTTVSPAYTIGSCFSITCTPYWRLVMACRDDTWYV